MSESETKEHVVSFPLTVPAHMNYMVILETRVLSEDDIFESSLRVEGSVGIEVETGDFTPNTFYYFFNIEAVFPDAAATSRIMRCRTYTYANVSVFKAVMSTDAQDPSTKTDADMVEFIPFAFEQAAAALEIPDDVGIVFAPDDIVYPSFVSTTLVIRFSGVPPPQVPLQYRRPKTEILRKRLQVSAIPFTRPLGNATYAPQDASVRIRVNYDTTRIGLAQLRNAIINTAHQMQWGGNIQINFI